MEKVIGLCASKESGWKERRKLQSDEIREQFDPFRFSAGVLNRENGQSPRIRNPKTQAFPQEECRNQDKFLGEKKKAWSANSSPQKIGYPVSEMEQIRAL